MLLDASRSQLVLVDYQARLMPALFDSRGGGLPTRCGSAASRSWSTCRCGAPSRTRRKPRREPAGNPRAVPAQTLAKDAFRGARGGPGRVAAPARPRRRRRATRAACPSTCRSRPPRRSSATRSWSPAARPMCACCRPRSADRGRVRGLGRHRRLHLAHRAQSRCRLRPAGRRRRRTGHHRDGRLRVAAQRPNTRASGTCRR